MINILRSIRTTALVFVFATAPVSAAPLLKSLDPIGAQQGRTFMLRLLGQELSVGTELITSLPATISRLAPPKDLKMPETEIPFLIQLRNDTAAGIYPIRVRNVSGISNVLLFSVGEFPEVQEKRSPAGSAGERTNGEFAGPSPIQKIAPPVVVNGTLAEIEQDLFSFNAVAGQTWVFEVEARRIGSAIDPTLRVMDASGRQLGFNDDAPLIGVDSRVQVTFPKTGEYRVAVQDTRFSRQEQNFYRLKIGPLLYPEGIFPLGWQRGGQIDVSLFGGNLPGVITIHPRLDFSAPQPITLISLPGRQGSAVTLPVPFVLGDFPEMLEPGTTAGRDLPADAVMNGRISQAGEKDRYRLKVKPGEKWLIEVDAAGLGTSRLHAYLNIYDAADKLLASAVDASNLNVKTAFSFSTPEKGVDPKIIFRVPDKTTEIILAIEDANLGGGPDYGYRLRASRQWEDFRLETAIPFANIPAAGSAVVPVRAIRTGYQGPIHLAVENAPDTLIVGGGNIAAGSREGLLTLTAKPGASANLLNIRIWGEGTTSAKQTIRRQASGPGLVTSIAGEPGISMKPFVARWLGMELPVTVTEPAALQFQIPERQIKVVQGLKRQLGVRLSSNAQGNYPVRVNIRLPSGANLKARTVTLPPGKENLWEGTLELSAEFDTSVGRFDLVLEARPEPPGRPINYVSPAIQVDIVRAYALELPTEALELRKGTDGQLTGKVIRESPFEGEVSVHLEDLPAHVTSATAQVAANASEFRLPVIVGPQAEPGEYEIRLASQGKMEGRKDKADYSIPDLTLKLVVPAGQRSAEK
ncbi:MAG TPA: hypothetical protein VGK99_18805 [Acidobacteriota bacterium]|jgi:hypothetical protein